MRVRLVFSATAQDRPAVEDQLGRVLPERDEVIERPNVVEAGLVRDTPGLALRLDRMDLLRHLETDAKWMRHGRRA